ncbi:hypothetical protein [uncultured Campylobacter sp.]|uniref:hypothetical protein n=1 Tax=uncultured Campylobacter sp. TaxID=218934 RepID=UPI002631E0F7|nr:hypothetical protein [uncultured Campylobacter sp.]
MKNLARIFLIAFILTSFSGAFAAQQSHKSTAAQQNHKYKISSQNLRAKDHPSKNTSAKFSAEPHAKKSANAKSLSNSKFTKNMRASGNSAKNSTQKSTKNFTKNPGQNSASHSARNKAPRRPASQSGSQNGASKSLVATLMRLPKTRIDEDEVPNARDTEQTYRGADMRRNASAQTHGGADEQTGRTVDAQARKLTTTRIAQPQARYGYSATRSGAMGHTAAAHSSATKYTARQNARAPYLPTSARFNRAIGRSGGSALGRMPSPERSNALGQGAAMRYDERWAKPAPQPYEPAPETEKKRGLIFSSQWGPAAPKSKWQQHEAPTDDASSRNESVMDMLQDKMSRVKVNMELVR